MSWDELDQVQVAHPGWVRRWHLCMCVAAGVGFVVAMVGLLRSSSSWDRYVHDPVAIGWLAGLLVVGAAFLLGRTGKAVTSMLLGSTLLAATAVGGGMWGAHHRKCDVGAAPAIVAEIVALTASKEGEPHRLCGGQDHASRARMTVALSPVSALERRQIIEFLDQHGLLDLDGVAFIAVFGHYNIEMELAAPGRAGSVLVSRARGFGR